MKTAAKTDVATATPTAARVPKLLERFATRYHVDPEKMATALKATVFRQKDAEISNEQLMMLLVVADQYQLNPFTAEIYAFPSQKGIIPIISVDGWIRIINSHPQLAGYAFAYDDENDWVECTIERKDRSQAIVVREYLEECRRDTGPWKSHPRRMLRHKALIQCARVAFGFAGVYDEDEGQRIVEVQATEVTPRGKPATAAPRAISQDPQPATQAMPETGETVDTETGEVHQEETEAGARG